MACSTYLYIYAVCFFVFVFSFMLYFGVCFFFVFLPPEVNMACSGSCYPCNYNPYLLFQSFFC